MRKIEITHLTLNNYRNIEFASYDFDGNSKIIGENRIGKTNTLEAIAWLLTDYLLDGGTDITQLKPLSDTKKVVSAEATFIVDDTTPLTIKKEYREKWVQTRGSVEKEFQGHETLYYINGTKQSTLKGYNKELEAQIGLDLSKVKANIDLKRLLTDPFYLGDLGESLNWKEFRSLITEIVGDVSDDDVFKKDASLSIIADELKKQNGRVDQAKKYVGQQITTLKKEIMINDANINNQSKILKPSEESVAIAKKGIEEHETNIATLRASNGIDTQSSQIQNELAKVRNEIVDVREEILNAPHPEREEYNALENDIRGYQSDIDTLLDKKRNYQNDKANVEREIAEIKGKIENCDRKRANLITKIKGIDKEIDEAPENAIKECPYCHRPYEEEKIAETIHQIIDKLNEQRTKIVDEGKANNMTKECLNADLEIKNEDLEVTLNNLHNVEGEIVQINTKMEVAKVKQTELNTPIDYTNNPLNIKLEKLIEQRDQLEKDLEESKRAYMNGTQDTYARIQEETNAMLPFKKVLDDLAFYDRTQVEIEKLKEEGKTKAMLLADAEQKFEAFNGFVRAKLEMLDNNVKKVFGNIKFQLIKENINGGYDAVCKPYIYDIENDKSTEVIWKSGSRSEKVVTGIAIAERIKEALDLPNFPFLFDQGGEISMDTFKTRFKTNSQIICVQVADNVPTPIVVSMK